MASTATLLDFFKEKFQDSEFDIYFNNGIGLAFRIKTKQRHSPNQIVDMIIQYTIRECLVCHDSEPQPFESGMIICRRMTDPPLPNLLSLRSFKEGDKFIIAVCLTPLLEICQ